MDGTVQTLTFDALKIHVYTAPAEALLVNSLVLEFADRLIVVDGQLLQQYAREVGDVVEGLGKRLDRFIITHNHPDHYAGFAHLTRRFPGVPLAALPAVRDYLLDKGDEVLAVRRQLVGEDVPDVAAIPDATLVPGDLTIAGVPFLLQQYDDAEAEHTLSILLPDQRVALVADLVGAPSAHLFTVRPRFDEWLAVLARIRVDVSTYGVTTLVVGHGQPLGPEVLPANVAYLRAAKAAFETSGTPEEYLAALQETLPDRGPREWVGFSSQLLYGRIAP